MEIDFSEIKDEGDKKLEAIAKEILQRKGFRVQKTGEGADGGKDLIFEEILEGPISHRKRKWIVDSKYRSNSKKNI